MTTKVELVGTVRFTVEIREVDLIGEAGGLVGAAQWMAGDELDRHFSGFGPITAEVQSWDYGEVLDYGAYRDPVKCPVCGGVYVEGVPNEYLAIGATEKGLVLADKSVLPWKSASRSVGRIAPNSPHMDAYTPGGQLPRMPVT